MDIHEYNYGNVVIKVYRPELTDTERKKRERQIESALSVFGKETTTMEST